MIKAFRRTLSFIRHHSLASRHVFMAYIKWIGWQLKSLKRNTFFVFPFVDNTRFFAKKGLTGITGNIYAGLHEFGEMAFLLHFLNKDDVFFDIGANVGSYTILASGVRKAKTLSFEPCGTTFDILVKNIKLNNLEALVSTINKGVGKSNKKVSFTANLDTINHVVEFSNDNTTSIQLVTLDSFFPEYKPSLIKIDVEGLEAEVISGANKLLLDKDLKAIIIELNGSGKIYGSEEEAVHQKLLAHGFYAHSYDPFKRLLSKLDNYGSHNTIYVRDLDFVNDRLTAAIPFQVFNEKI